MGRIIVCPFSRVEQVVRETGAGSLVSLLNPPLAPRRPAAIAPDRHLVLEFSDIVATQEGHILAGAHHIDSLLGFVRCWDRSCPLVVHCYAGVSRSPAAAYIAACALTETPEFELAQNLRRLSVSATPNRHLIALADRILSREGRMIAAIESIGRGADCFEGETFFMDLT